MYVIYYAESEFNLTLVGTKPWPHRLRNKDYKTIIRGTFNALLHA